MELDLLHPTPDEESSRHKLKRLVPSPNSFFMDIRCPGCYSLTTAFSHAQNVITCEDCSQVLARPTGGRCQLTIGCSYRRKAD